MTSTLTIRDETLGGESARAWDLEVTTERLTVRELIRSRVYQEVQDFNRLRGQVFHGLVQPEEAEKALNGWKLKRPRLLDWKQQFDRAIEAFESNGVATSQATVNANILDEFGGNIQIGDNTNSGLWAALTVNGNVDIENGALTLSVLFDGNGNLSNYSRLHVFGQFAVNAEQGEWTSTLSINTILTNNVQPMAGQVVGLVTATTTSTANPPEAFTVFDWNNGYQYNNEAMTASGYQLTT